MGIISNYILLVKASILQNTNQHDKIRPDEKQIANYSSRNNNKFYALSILLVECLLRGIGVEQPATPLPSESRGGSRKDKASQWLSLVGVTVFSFLQWSDMAHWWHQACHNRPTCASCPEKFSFRIRRKRTNGATAIDVHQQNSHWNEVTVAYYRPNKFCNFSSASNDISTIISWLSTG